MDQCHGHKATSDCRRAAAITAAQFPNRMASSHQVDWNTPRDQGTYLEGHEPGATFFNRFTRNT
jgi:hypothetical protein